MRNASKFESVNELLKVIHKPAWMQGPLHICTQPIQTHSLHKFTQPSQIHTAYTDSHIIHRFTQPTQIHTAYTDSHSIHIFTHPTHIGTAYPMIPVHSCMQPNTVKHVPGVMMNSTAPLICRHCHTFVCKEAGTSSKWFIEGGVSSSAGAFVGHSTSSHQVADWIQN